MSIEIAAADRSWGGLPPEYEELLKAAQEQQKAARGAMRRKKSGQLTAEKQDQMVGKEIIRQWRKNLSENTSPEQAKENHLRMMDVIRKVFRYMTPDVREEFKSEFIQMRNTALTMISLGEVPQALVSEPEQAKSLLIRVGRMLRDEPVLSEYREQLKHEFLVNKASLKDPEVLKAQEDVEEVRQAAVKASQDLHTTVKKAVEAAKRKQK
ncbi:MAG TPA: hypothetical protein VLE95_02430 [Chlamydiales bacterium]|nr:hypothetical protein [Chlamydiales bacterium]